MNTKSLAFRGPLCDRYGAAVTLVVFALIPYLALSSAFTALTPVIARSVHLSPQAMQLTGGMANAAYAFGTVLSVQFAVHLRGRRMLLLYAVLFVLGSAMAASALTPGLFIAGHVLQGLTTSLMLIAAVPPLVIGWPSSKLPITAMVMNLCIFGAVALGPVIGGVQADAGAWQPLFWIVTGFGGVALLFVILTFEDQLPQDRSAPWDWLAIVLAGGGSAAAFFGASELMTHPMLSVIVFLPLMGGLAALVGLILNQYCSRHPLMPLRNLATTIPVAGIVVAMCAGAASVAIVALTETALQMKDSPAHLGMLFWPEFGAAAFSAVVFGYALRTRMIGVIAIGGMAMLAAGAAVLTGVATGGGPLVLVGSGLVGLGVGASVAPSLFAAGFSLRSMQLPRIFALVELLRGVAAFLVGPIVLHLAMTTGGKNKVEGLQIGLWTCFGIAAAGGLIALYLVILGGARPQRPDLDSFLAGEAPAWHSPPLADAIRGDSGGLTLLTQAILLKLD